jgi:multidrug efflux pump subunit AcrA (membrane-fusion protein)
VGIAVKLANRPTTEPAPPEKRLANVAVQEVKARPYAESLILPAQLEADRMGRVGSELAGRLERWLVDEGATVTKGQVLAELNDDDLRAKLAELEVQKESIAKQVVVSQKDLEVAEVSLDQAKQDAKALQLTLDSAQSDLDFARKDSERVTGLAKADIATQAELDRVRNQLKQAEVGVAKAKDAMERAQITIRTAQARVGQSEAALDLARVRVQENERSVASVQVTLAKTKIHAPFAGQFEEYLVEAGDVVSPGLLLGKVYDLSYMRVAVDVPDRYAPFLEEGNPLLKQYLAKAMPGTRQDLKAMVQIPGLPKLTGGRHAGIEIPARIVRVAEAANSLSHTFRVELRFANPSLTLRAGIIVRASIDFLTYDNAIVIPMAAIQVADVGPRALVVTEEEDGPADRLREAIPRWLWGLFGLRAKRTFAHVRDIEPVSIRNDQVLVQSGLVDGETLIVAGGKGVLDGEQVNVVMADGEIVDHTNDGKDTFIPVPAEGAEGEAEAAPPEGSAEEPKQ